MRQLDTMEGIVDHNYSENERQDQNTDRADLSLSKDRTNLLTTIHADDDSILASSIRELVRVYELVREGKLK